MAQLDQVLLAINAIEAAAKRGDWSFVEKSLPTFEKTIKNVTQETEANSFTREDLEIIKSIRLCHAQVRDLALAQQGKIRSKIASVVSNNKAHRAYSGDSK